MSKSLCATLCYPRNAVSVLVISVTSFMIIITVSIFTSAATAVVVKILLKHNNLLSGKSMFTLYVAHYVALYVTHTSHRFLLMSSGFRWP